MKIIETVCVFSSDKHLATGYFAMFHNGLPWGMVWACDKCATERNGVRL